MNKDIFHSFFELNNRLLTVISFRELLKLNIKLPIIQRLKDSDKIKQITSFQGDPCDRCGNFTVYKEDNKIKCLTCLHKFDE